MFNKKLIILIYYTQLILLILLYFAPSWLMKFLFNFEPGIAITKNYEIGLSIYHLIYMFILTVFGLLKNGLEKKNILLLFIISFSIELLHYFIPYRSFEIKDYLGNIAGFLLATITFAGVNFIKKYYYN